MIAQKEAALEGKVENIPDVTNMKVKVFEFGYDISSSSDDEGPYELHEAKITIKDDTFVIDDAFYKDDYFKKKYGCPEPKAPEPELPMPDPPVE